MAKPQTPHVGCDVFILNAQSEVLLVQRSDNEMWCLPGGTQDFGESPKECAIRECFEESGYVVEVTELLGAWSSMRYEYVNYPWTENEFSHLVFRAEIRGGEPTLSNETINIGWFRETELPQLSDGHAPRIDFGFRATRDPLLKPYFE